MKPLKLVPLVIALALTFAGIAQAQVKFSFPEESKNYAVNLDPGEETSVDITFTNVGSKAVELNAYTVDGAMTSSGSFAAKLLSDPQILLGKWSGFEKNLHSIAPRDTLTIPLTISIPKDATPRRLLRSRRHGI